MHPEAGWDPDHHPHCRLQCGNHGVEEHQPHGASLCGATPSRAHMVSSLVVNSNDRSLVNPARELLMRMLVKGELRDAFLPVSENKQGLPNAVNLAQTTDKLVCTQQHCMNGYQLATCASNAHGLC
ncbi:ADP-ribosylation factor 3-like [Hyaena hyaena]|uniref:ADP-ribosylation factor 3-like n=1 Tax=Hyaena hyaena TaxID=95912 RepID=UPI0019244680|nr:ADP-ribosylation factor 3-like [Hyaena hyaena]